MLVWILGTVGGLLLLFALLSPLESLRWWSTRGATEMRRTYELLEQSPSARPAGEQPPRYVVYMSGVGMIDGHTLSARERAFCDNLAAALPGVPVIAEVFPYAVDNRSLVQRATAWLWGRLVRLRKARRESIAPNLINLRNTLQVMVSADPRYGPTLNAGLAQEIWRALLRHGYTPGCGVPVTLIGYSGGAQMALGASTMLTLLGVEVSVMSIGGVFGDDPGLDHITHLWDVRGTRDTLRKVGPAAFPGRWPTSRGSTWHRAVEDGRVTILDGGPVVHEGRGSYFEARVAGSDGVMPADRLLVHVVGALGGPPAVSS